MILHRYRHYIVTGLVLIVALAGYVAYEGPQITAKRADCQVLGYIQEPRVAVKCQENRWDAREVERENLRHTPMIGEILRCRWDARMFFRFQVGVKGVPVCSPHTTYYFDDDK